LLDAVHCAAGLRFQIVGHVLRDLVALVRMIVIDGERGRAGEPENLSALDLDRRHERHEHVLVVVRMMDDLHVLVLGRGGSRREGHQRQDQARHACRTPQRRRCHHDTLP